MWPSAERQYFADAAMNQDWEWTFDLTDANQCSNSARLDEIRRELR
jgi:hypothetical protein